LDVKKEEPKVIQRVEKPTQLPEVEKAPVVKEEEPISSVPLPGQPKPTAIVEEKIEPNIETELTDRKAAKATENAFQGAFGIATETSQHEDNTQAEDIEDEVVAEAVLEEIIVDEQESEEPFISAAEMFIQSDTDGDGSLSVEELSQATGLSIEEVEEIHESADLDDDGSMSLSEFVASPVVEKVASNLPKPVAPVRRPVSLGDQSNAQQSPTKLNTPQPQQSFPHQPINRPIPPQNVNPHPINRPQPINQQPHLQQWNQPVQPTIRSGVMCRSCGIGIDPYWRFCPVCGGQNLG